MHSARMLLFLWFFPLALGFEQSLGAARKKKAGKVPEEEG